MFKQVKVLLAVVAISAIGMPALAAPQSPSATVRLVNAGVSEQTITTIVNLQVELGIDQQRFNREFFAIALEVTDMVRAGFTEAQVVTVLRETMTANPRLGEVTTITSALIDMVKVGISKAEAMALMREAIKANPNLETVGKVLTNAINRKEAEKERANQHNQGSRDDQKQDDKDDDDDDDDD